MKQLPLKQLMVAAFLVCAAPVSMFAQKDDKAKEKPKKQQIVITRTGDETGKTVIEIDGDKVKINGKDAADLKDVNVRLNNLRGTGALALGGGRNDAFNFNFDLDQPTRIWKADSSRAMLGVITDGDDRGAEIQSITKESAAEKAGLKKGDIITKIDNKKIETTDDVTETVRAHKPGEKVSISYLRDGKEQKTTAELGFWKGVNMTTMVAPRVLTDQVWRNNAGVGRSFDAFPGMPAITLNRTGRIGMSVQDTDDGKGVKVLEVEDEGAAEKAGLKEDDIITQVDGQAVNSADEISKLMREKREQPFVKLQVTRNGQAQTFNVRMKQPKTVDL